MATLREFLTESGFDFAGGRLIVRRDRATGRYIEGDYHTQAEDGVEVSMDDPILDAEFDSGFGDAECPAYVAEDSKALHFPYTYDGATGPTKVLKDLSLYLLPENKTPYPGG